MSSILVVDDEKSLREFISIILEKEGYEVVSTGSGEEAIDILKKDMFDLVISDIKLPNSNGITVLETVKDISPDTTVIMITAYGSTETAIEALKKGAYDYITKPFKIDELNFIIKNALEKKKLREENIYLKTNLKEKYQFSNIIGKSQKMLNIFDMIMKISNSRSTVLITGESGTGKELVAKAIHFNSNRAAMPFISVNCGALPEQLLESELFGHQKGAFTSADSNKEGLLELANGGTFFLDEIGEAPISIQVKLLRALQEKEFKRVGGVKNIKVDVRIIAASNKDLLGLVSKGVFREDLYYRLNVISIELPPLRERKEDLPLLVDAFIQKYNNIVCKNIKGISSECMKLLETYKWYGNVRELENIIERAMVLETSDIIKEKNLPDEILFHEGKASRSIPRDIPEDGIDLEKILSEIEKDLLLEALRKSNGVFKQTASLLNLSFRSLRYRLNKYNIKLN